MKILLINDYGVLAGGAERITVDIRDGLRARGHDARMLASTAQPLPLPSEADYTCAGSNAWPQRMLQVTNPWAVRRLRQVLSDFDPDIVHVRMFLSQLSPSILPLLRGRPSVLHLGNHQTICPINTRVLPDHTRCTANAGVACFRYGCVSPLGLVRTILQLRSWRRHRGVFRLIVANSEALADALRANGVDVTAIVQNGTRRVAARPPLADPPTIAYAGRLTAVKGVDVLMRAMRDIVDQLPGARLLIAGDGPDRRPLERLADTLGLHASVAFLGHVEHPALAAQLASAWVQAVPSTYPEPSANVIPEAMMRGTAVVATDVGGSPEAVVDGTTGFLVRARDAGHLAARLLDVLRDRRLAERLGEAGRRVALERLSTDVMLDRFEAIYEHLVPMPKRQEAQDH